MYQTNLTISTWHNSTFPHLGDLSVCDSWIRERSSVYWPFPRRTWDQKYLKIELGADRPWYRMVGFGRVLTQCEDQEWIPYYSDNLSSLHREKGLNGVQFYTDIWGTFCWFSHLSIWLWVCDCSDLGLLRPIYVTDTHKYIVLVLSVTNISHQTHTCW